MLGQRLTPLSYHPAAQIIPEAQLRQSLEALKSNIAHAVDTMPTHEEWLRGFAAQDS
jgi:tryptophan halogenase